jgi:hypothetical protein
VDFSDLLARSLPGLYLDKDDSGDLHRFLDVMAIPLAEVERSISQLHEDCFISSCRDQFIGLLGQLVGVEVDPTQLPRAQRAQVFGALDAHRGKGLFETLQQLAESITGWRITLVDFSQRLTATPVVDSLNPIVVHRDTPVGEAGPGRFFFRSDRTDGPLFDGVTGRVMTREALAGHEQEYAGGDRRFTIRDRAVDLFLQAEPPFRAISADLADFDKPLTPTGAALEVADHQIAVDPELGRFRLTAPVPLAGNLTAAFSVLRPAPVQHQVFNIAGPDAMERLGRSDDPAPYSVDLRVPVRAADRIGRQHVDNVGFFFIPSRPMVDRKPNVLPAGSESGRFTFDDRPLGSGDTQGTRLQLLDGIDGTPLTRRTLARHTEELCGTRRGFTIRVNGVSVTHPGFVPALRIRVANLEDFDNATDPDGRPLSLDPTDVAVDPQTGRFRMDLAAVGTAAEHVRVDYLLANVDTSAGPATPLSQAVPELFSFSQDGGHIRLRDALDGTAIGVALHLGMPLAAYHSTARGWTILRNGEDVGLVPEVMDLADEAAPVSAGRIAVDVNLGRFKLPTGRVGAGDRFAVTFAFEDPWAVGRIIRSLVQQLPRAVPAGVTPVIVDARRTLAVPLSPVQP